MTASFCDFSRASLAVSISATPLADASSTNSSLLIDSHDAPVDAAVWALYRQLIERIGPRPTLIERDDQLPAFETLMVERARAQQTLDEVAGWQ